MNPRNKIIERRFAEGATYDVIANEIGVTRNVVAGHLRRKGIRRHPAPPSLNEYFEDCLWTSDRMKKLIIETLGEDRFDMAERSHRAALFLFGSYLVGAVPSDVATATGLGREECRHFDGKARGLEIIAGNKIDYPPWMDKDPLTATLNFVLDSMTVAGKFKCEGPRGPNCMYSLA